MDGCPTDVEAVDPSVPQHLPCGGCFAEHSDTTALPTKGFEEFDQYPFRNVEVGFARLGRKTGMLLEVRFLGKIVASKRPEGSVGYPRGISEDKDFPPKRRKELLPVESEEILLGYLATNPVRIMNRLPQGGDVFRFDVVCEHLADSVKALDRSQDKTAKPACRFDDNRWGNTSVEEEGHNRVGQTAWRLEISVFNFALC